MTLAVTLAVTLLPDRTTAMRPFILHQGYQLYPLLVLHHYLYAGIRLCQKLLAFIHGVKGYDAELAK